jgi:hypothetical protein
MLVCKECFGDKELKGLITALSNLGKCDICEKIKIEIINIEELFDFFKELFDNFQLKPDGERLISKIQGNWNLFSNIDCGNKVINYVVGQIDTQIQSSEQLIDFNDDILENVNFWSQLKEQLKWERRYLTNIDHLTLDLGWDGFFESRIVLKNTDALFRARLHHISNEDIYSSHQMYSPPKEKANAGRANPTGIPYLYLSDNEETVLYEVRASYLDEISVATFSLKSSIETDVFISDFTETPTLFHPSEVNKRIKSTLLKQQISRDLSKPMRRYDSELDYVPTQFICEFIKVFTGVHGIKFRSSLHTLGNNIVIFNQDILDCISVKKVNISQLNIGFRNL